MSAAKRLIYADLLRLFAIAVVVVLHVSARALVKAPAFGPVWWSGNLFDSLSRWSVPVFVMISGMLMLGATRQESVSDFLRRRFSKILIPLAFWSGIYLTFRAVILKETISLWTVLHDLIAGPAFYHLWFMYVILGLYLITPLLRLLLQAAKPEDLRYFLVLWLLFSCLFPLSANLLKLPVGIHVEMVTGYVGYFLLGHVLEKYRPLLQFSRIWLWAALFFGAALTIGGTYFLTLQKKGFLDQLLFSYFSPNVVLMAVAVYGLFQSFQYPAKWTSSPVLTRLSVCSFGVYLVHPLLLAFLLNTRLGGLRLETVLTHHWWGIPVCSFLIFSLSLGLVLGMRKLPGLREVVP